MRVVLLAGGTFLATAYCALASEGTSYTAPDAILSLDALGPQTAFGTASGYDFGNGFRTQVEGLSARGGAPAFGGGGSAGNFVTSGAMFTTLYEFRNRQWQLKPFVGFGIGAVGAQQQIAGLASDVWTPAYQVRGGVHYNITQKLIGDFEFRWTEGQLPALGIAGIPAKVQIDRHKLLLGLNYHFF